MASPGSIGSAMPPSEDTQVRKFADLERFVRELGPSVAQSLATTVKTLQDLVAQVTATIADINAQVATAISANSYTQTVIDSKIANPPAGSAVTGNISATGNLGVTGTANIGGVVTADAGMSSLDARNRVLSSSYGSVYADGSGRFGQAPSSRRFKQDITPTTVDPAAVYAAQIVNFRYIGAVADEGSLAVLEIGGIAEQFEACGLGQFVARDSDGAVFGIQYERLTVALIATVQSLNARLVKLGG